MTEAKEFIYNPSDQFSKKIDLQITEFLKNEPGATIVSLNYTIVQTDKGLMYAALLIYST